MRQRLGLDEINELLVGSPFDYKSNALIYLPTDLPEPNAPFYQKSMEQTLIALCKATEGRALILLTSHSAVRTTYYAIGRPLEEAFAIETQCTKENAAMDDAREGPRAFMEKRPPVYRGRAPK